MARPTVIASDLDGTFLTDTKTVHPLNDYAVRRAGELGVPFIFATGRPARWMQPLRALTTGPTAAICNNGAMTFDLHTGEVIDTHPIDVQVAAEVIAELNAALGSAVFAFEYESYWGAEDAYPLRHGEHADIRGTWQSLLQADPIIKILVLDPARHTHDLASIVEPVVGDALTATFSFISDQGMMEIAAPGVSKAQALVDHVAREGLDLSGLVAFGDMPNDRAMLDLAAQAYTMAEAHHSLHEAGYPIAGSHNDAGVGRTVLRLLGEPVPELDPEHTITVELG